MAATPNPHVVCAKLVRLEPSEIVLPAQLEGLNWSTAERLASRLMTENGVHAIKQKVNKRSMDMKEEKRDNLSSYARKERQKAYRQGFSTIVLREAYKMGFSKKLSGSSLREAKKDITSNKKYFLQMVDFLLNRSSTRSNFPRVPPSRPGSTNPRDHQKPPTHPSEKQKRPSSSRRRSGNIRPDWDNTLYAPEKSDQNSSKEVNESKRA
eukprot:CAMPEP_0167742468 /NCGR_PEP_ID=MMETSP0110_2-20121227/1451_1 /TAXON_ID=629695 /ORGANISM="Gymnochlora sp., Strain CCMP2014" /LENGTH=208 /DNA_ID=CAMNT_0007626679 /DNA_START=135 /DNA_END=758 /DNA_ORIENTATION=+